MIRALVLGLALALGACTSVPKLPTNLSEAQASAQASINDANAWLTATSNVIAANVKEGIMTKAEGQAALDKVRAIARQVDEAQAFLRAGNPKAVDVAQLAQRAIIALHREVAARARAQ